MKQVLVVLLAIFALGMLIGALFAHEAPTGWHYDGWCCNNRDCAPETAEVIATDRGWFITSTGETMPYKARGVLPSGDSNFHRCVFHSGAKAGQTRCLYVPPMGF